MNPNTFVYVIGNPPYGGTINAPKSLFANKKGHVAPDLAIMEAFTGILEAQRKAGYCGS